MKSRRAVHANWIASATVLAWLGCSSAKPEAAALASSVELFHRASNAERPGRADAIARLECQDREVCAARAACVDATSATAAALRLTDENEIVMAALEAHTTGADDVAVKALPAKLEEASKLLKRGLDAMPDCDHKILVLRERYGL